MRRGDVVLVELPTAPGAPGHEQGGPRPALVIQNNRTIGATSVVMVVPFTGKLGALRFPHTVRVAATTSNGLNCESVALVLQLRAIDTRRIKKPLGAIDNADLLKIESEIHDLLAI
ncbi:MAG: type II toxin-antitoxin system PemK/MazF family toxin [Elusimicrobia bacterium]|nr:type II toxin-antitoxin system PemK/MazF family toxin [Elusimicrobiota bacterium]